MRFIIQSNADNFFIIWPSANELQVIAVCSNSILKIVLKENISS